MPEKVEVSVAVPPQIIDAHIRAAVATALGKDTDKLVKAVVDLAMDAKRNSYDRNTIFQESVNAVIRETATSVLREFTESIREKIRERLVQKLRAEPDEFADKIATACIDGLGKSLYVSASMKVDE